MENELHRIDTIAARLPPMVI